MKTIDKIKIELTSRFEGKLKDKIEKAIAFEEVACKDKCRNNGDPELIHPLSVALTIIELGLGPNAICAALLHSSIYKSSDQEAQRELILKEFGNDIYNLVNKLTLIQEKGQKAESVKNIRVEAAQKFLLSSTEDLRVMMIKLADKLHCLQTAEGINPQNRRDAFFDELERIYIPISEYMGLGNLNKQLKDTLFQKRNPREFKIIEKFVSQNLELKDDYVNKILEELETICNIDKLDVKIYGRFKSVSSIYSKQQKYLKDGEDPKIESIFDILAFRIITNSIDDCYSTLSLLQGFYEEIEAEHDDYIANPKPNGYRSLQTAFIHPEYGRFEVQIRTEEMHLFAEFGPASHVAYKKAGTRNSNASKEYDWVKSLHKPEMINTTDQAIKISLFKNDIFVFTPKNDVIQLPKESTPIDFAYSLHTELGDQCMGAKVNGNQVSLETKLNNGDLIELLINPKKKYANENWLESVKTGRARDKIKRSLNRKLFKM